VRPRRATRPTKRRKKRKRPNPERPMKRRSQRQKKSKKSPPLLPEPSEADKIVEDLGGVDVLKAVRPLIESIYNPDLTPSARLEALVKAVPEEQAKAIRNEFFWQATAVPEVQEGPHQG
jgi:hypothetical protein